MGNIFIAATSVIGLVLGLIGYFITGIGHAITIGYILGMAVGVVVCYVKEIGDDNG